MRIKNYLRIQSKVSAGFTLIELAIVMAIVGIMSVVVMLSFGTQNTKKALETNAREFVGVLREAQNYALTGKQNATNTVCAYNVVWAASGSTYTLQSQVKNGDFCTGGFSNVASYPLKQGVTFSGAGNARFLLPWGVFSGSSSAVLNRGGDAHTVCLTTGGKITDQAGNVSCP